MPQAGVDLLSGDVEAINEYMADRHADGLSTNSLIKYQSAARAFINALEVDADPDDVDTYTPDDTPRHDQRDLFTEDEVFALRDAAGRTQNPTRNRAFLELLIFTLQRVTALLTLRVGDVDLEDGAIYLNADYDAEHGGLKGALRRGRRRPVYGARKYLRDWMLAHPTGAADYWLFVGEASNPATGDDYWNPSTAHEMLQRLGELAEVDKPTNAHNFRHYGVTVLRRDYGVSWDEINAQAGVVKGSDLPRKTYNHVDDAELMDNIEAAMGLADEDRNRFAPVVCPVCDEVMKADWRECPACGERFAPGETLDDQFDEEQAVADDAFERAVYRALKRMGYAHD
jgi:integrase